MTDNDAAIGVFLALAVILVACWTAGKLARFVGQPPVVGEMIVGVCLGPSLLGAVAPGVMEWLFPQGTSMSILFMLSQLGLVLYMFLIGLEFDTSMVRQRARTAASLSAAGVGAPLILGGVFALVLLADRGTYFATDASAPQAMLFLGAALATTAFPMLARIILERGLTGSSMGTVALAAGAAVDAMSWCLLAIVLAVFGSQPQVAALAIAGGVLYTLGMLTIGRRGLRVLTRGADKGAGNGSPLSQSRITSKLPVVLALLMAAAWLTDVIGIYSIFGAFVFGVAMPRGRFADGLRTTMEPLVTRLLLPLFFVYSGLNTQIGLVNTATLWGMTLLILAISVLSKGVACWAAAWMNGVPQREAVALGGLMNARGLIELILLNIALEAGFITPTLFSMLVLMAVGTTLMATPIFDISFGRHYRRQIRSTSANGNGSAHPSRASSDHHPVSEVAP